MCDDVSASHEGYLSKEETKPTHFSYIYVNRAGGRVSRDSGEIQEAASQVGTVFYTKLHLEDGLILEPS